MRGIQMPAEYLGELQVLLKMYEMAYGGVGQELLDEIEGHYRERLESQPPGGRYTQRNPRGAGRISKYSQEEIEKLYEMHRSGKSIREISKETGIARSTVQELISGQRGSLADPKGIRYSE